MTINELNEIKQNYKVIEITADFISPSYNISRAKHLDTARYLLCTLTEDGVPRKVKTDETARIRLQKPDKTYAYNDCDILDDGRVFITLTEQILAVEGNAVCDIQLTDEETGIIYSTKNFIINIDKTAVSNSVIESTNEFSALNNLIATNKKLNEELNENETVRKSNEIKRISDEDTRNSNENTRKSMEIQRTNAESIRVSNENTRITDENIRISNENTRKSNEINRQNDTALAISNSEKATQKANDAAEDLQNKLDSHYFASSNDLQEHNSSAVAHNDIRTLISELTSRVNTLADSDDTTIDQNNKFLQLSGGTVDGNTTFKNTSLNILTLARKDTANGAAIQYKNNAKVLGHLGFDGSGVLSKWEGDTPTANSRCTILDSKNYVDYAAQKEHSHDGYLSLTGGTVDGSTAFRQGIRGYSLSSSASHGKGTSGWQYAFQITTTGTYQNQFLEFSIVQRNRIGKLYIKLVSNKTAGVVSVGEFYTIGNINVSYVCSDNALDVYIQKSEAYDEIDCLITHKGSYMNGTVITWIDTVVSSLPDGAVAALSNTINLDDKTGNVEIICDTINPSNFLIKRNSDTNGAFLGFSNNNNVLGYVGVSGTEIPHYVNAEKQSYPILLANKSNIGSVSFTTNSSGGTTLTLDNNNSTDNRTYLAFKNKGVQAGYLSMSGNDLYTYKNKANCKVLDTDNFNDSVSLKQVCSFTHAAYGGVCTVYRYGMIIAVTISGLWATGNNNVLVGDTNFVGVGNQKHYVDEYGNYIQFTGGGEIHLVINSSQGGILNSSFSATALFMIHST